MKVDFLTSSGSWMEDHIERMKKHAKISGQSSKIFNHHEEIRGGDILFILSYMEILEEKRLEKYENNIVIHASDLPKGRGMSPMSWKIAQDEREITFTLFEAVPKVDAGPFYDKQVLRLDGNELHSEWKELEGLMIEKMVLDFIDKYPNIESTQQSGDPTYYESRSHDNDEIDIHSTFEEAFHKIRVCNPEEYPAWFEYEGRKFKVVIRPWKN